MAFWSGEDEMDNEMESGLKLEESESELVGMESESDQGHNIDGFGCESSSDDQMQVSQREQQTKGIIESVTVVGNY